MTEFSGSFGLFVGPERSHVPIGDFLSGKVVETTRSFRRHIATMLGVGTWRYHRSVKRKSTLPALYYRPFR